MKDYAIYPKAFDLFRDTYSVPCPHCRAHSRSKCKDPRGYRIGPHSKRIKRAMREHAEIQAWFAKRRGE